MNSTSMSAAELRAAAALSLVFFLRMLPLFMLLPVLALVQENYANATPLLLGIALGIYGLTQALFQIPFGTLSDRFGRKAIITVGLIVFITGSLLAAISDSITGLILGRALQGAGAIAAAIMALASDLTREIVRTKAMALIGISIGLAFSIAFVIGPLLYSEIGLSGLFHLSAGMGFLAIMMLWLIVPNPGIKTGNQDTTFKPGKIKSVFTHPELIRLDLSIFTSHLILMANFVVIPIGLRDQIGLNTTSHWQVYLAVIFLSLIIMVPFIMLGDRLNKTKTFFLSSILLILTSQVGLALFQQQLIYMCFFMVLFFGAFNYLEAMLPSEVSKRVEPENKGTALGVYSTSQFIGIFIGGLAGGFLHQQHGIAAVYLFCLLVCFIWFTIVMNFSCDREQLQTEPEQESG